MPEFEISNVVGSVAYRQELDLPELANAFEQLNEVTSVSYNPSRNHWLQTRFAPDETYVAFYRNGSCSIVGCHSLDYFHETAEQVNEVIGRLLNLDYQPRTEVSNIVATADLGERLHLELLSLELGFENVEYEPEQFPALVYRLDDSVILVFSSGKILCTGQSTLDEISDTLEKFKGKLRDIA